MGWGDGVGPGAGMGRIFFLLYHKLNILRSRSLLLARLDEVQEELLHYFRRRRPHLRKSFFLELIFSRPFDRFCSYLV